MGYYTRYALSWTIVGGYRPPPPCAHKNDASAKFCQECGADLGKVAPDRLIGDAIEALESGVLGRDGSSQDTGKWYEHEVDMAGLSARFPGILFHLTGEGEEAGDIWDLYALNGEVQKHKARVVRQEAPDPKAWTKAKVT